MFFQALPLLAYICLSFVNNSKDLQPPHNTNINIPLIGKLEYIKIINILFICTENKITILFEEIVWYIKKSSLISIQHNTMVLPSFTLLGYASQVR